jgi:RNA polymerase sigma-70 factor, ECF subfamily
VAYRIINDAEHAQDIVQETYLTVLQKGLNFLGQSSLKTYLFRIVINKSIDCKRRQGRLHAVLETFSREFLPDIGVPADDNDNKELVRSLLRGVPDMFRVPMVLADVDGMSYGEIADILEVPLNTVRSRIARGRKKLRKQFEKTGRFQ